MLIVFLTPLPWLGAPQSFIAVPVGLNDDKQVSDTLTLLVRLYHCPVKGQDKGKTEKAPK